MIAMESGWIDHQNKKFKNKKKSKNVGERIFKMITVSVIQNSDKK